MRRLLPGGLTGLFVALTLVVATATGSALAYFTTTGAGSTQAGVSKLSAPAISGATPGVGGTVALTWGAVTPPGSGTIAYSVTRDGGTPAGNCPSGALPSAVTTCTDSGVGVGTHSYVVTARWRSWSAVSSTSTAKVTVGPVTHFDLKAASTSPTAGAADNLTITAQDENNATVTTYSGSHNLAFTGASASPGGTSPTVSNSSGTAVAFGSTTAIGFTAGVASVSSSKNGVMRLYRSGATSVSAGDGTIATATPVAMTVGAAAASKLAFSNVSISAGSLGATCFFTCAVTGLGNGGTIKANVLVADTYGNTINAIGSGKAVKITANGGTISGTPLAINSTGPAETASQFTYTAPAGGSYSNTITAATSEGTTYTSATITAGK